MPISYSSIGYRPQRWFGYEDTFCPAGPRTQVLNYLGAGYLTGFETACNPGNMELWIDGVIQFNEVVLPGIMYNVECEFFEQLEVYVTNGGVGANTVVTYRYF